MENCDAFSGNSAAQGQPPIGLNFDIGSPFLAFEQQFGFGYDLDDSFTFDSFLPPDSAGSTNNTTPPALSHPEPSPPRAPDDRDLFEPRYSRTSRLNKVARSTGRLLKAFQVSGTLSVREMQELGQTDSKRVYDIAKGLEWAGVIGKWGKSYIFNGRPRQQPVELHNATMVIGALEAKKARKAEELNRLREMYRAMIRCEAAPTGSIGSQ
jgi:hypothetical protein